MNVGHYMTKDVVTVTSDVKLAKAIDIMDRNQFHRLPVVDDGEFVGLITEQLIAENSPSHVSSLSIYEMNYLFDKVRVKDIMIKDAVTATPDMLIEAAAVLMSEKNITVLPVLTPLKEVIGIITHKDIFKALIDLTGYQEDGTRVVIELPEDKIGIIASLSKALADQQINITHMFVRRPSNRVELTIQTDGLKSYRTKQTIEKLGYTIVHE
ncbi:CBS domain-containing protein [Alkalibacterium iburiense]|uniref:CBS domain-containing protein n=1 Tax=Alkalibacterium iburiense TaxID=290589 RepID=A0ABN0X2S4_9LACT